MTRQGWLVPCLSHGKDDQLQDELSELSKAYRKKFQTDLHTKSGDIIDPSGEFLYVYLDEENYPICRQSMVLVSNAPDGLIATTLEPYSDSYTFRQVREQLQAFSGDGGRINYSRNEHSSSYFLTIQASNEFKHVGAVRNTFGQSKDIWKRRMPDASQPLDYHLIAVGCSAFLPEAALDDVESDGAV
uniref:6a protein n=1 Tax=Plasmid Ti TaxID=2512 RepID=Q52604_9ZZZZ|nr:6a [Plasmid Ti]prf//1303354A gene T-DNA transcript 6a [Escherichia coli]